VTASDHAQCTQTVAVQPNTTYALSAWVRGNYVYLGVTGGPSTWTPSAASYTRLSVSYTTAAGQTSVQVYLHGWYAQGTYYADDVGLSGPGGGTPSPSAPGSPSPSRSSTGPGSPSPQPSSSQPAPGGGLPKHALIGYLHASFANGSGYTRMADVPAAWDIINLAFGEPTSVTSGDIRFNRCPAAECPGVESDGEFTAAIRTKQAQGKKVLISIGGQNGQVQLTTTAARDAFVNSVSAIIDRYGLDGLDVDFEGHSLFLNSGPITGLDDQWHTMGGADFPIAMTDMLLAGFPVANTGQTFPALRPDQVAIGLPAAVSAGNGYLAPAVVRQALDCLVKGQNCGGYTLRGGPAAALRGLMTWSINWDRFYGYEFQNSHEPYLNGLP